MSNASDRQIGAWRGRGGTWTVEVARWGGQMTFSISDIVKPRSLVKMDTESTASTTSISYFDRVPNEILSLILSFVAFPPDPLPYSPDSLQQLSKHPRPIMLEPIFVIRWVSRRFRIIANELDLWRDDLFLFTNGLSVSTLHPLQQARLVRNWLHDAAFVRTLLNRRRWNFNSLDVFYAIVTELPEVFRLTESITFAYFPDGVNIAITRLDQFSQLSVLRIFVSEDVEDPIDLGLVATACPLLHTLVLLQLRDYYGSLEHAFNLELLSIHFQQKNNHNAVLSSLLFPVHSAETLTSFDLTSKEFDNHDVSSDFLDPYVNLKDLELAPLTPEFCTAISQARFTLTDLYLKFAPEEADADKVDKMKEMLSAESLRFLTMLSFDLDCRNCDETDEEVAGNEVWGDMITSAIVKLRYLKELELTMGMRASWFDRFSRLKNLKSLTLEYYYIEYSDLGHLSNPVTLVEIRDRSLVQAGNLLDEAFTAFAHKPHVSLRCHL